MKKTLILPIGPVKHKIWGNSSWIQRIKEMRGGENALPRKCMNQPTWSGHF